MISDDALITLIAGTSHVGKSTLSARLAQARGCEVISTDSIARHPGRPWPDPAPHIIDYYTALSAATIHRLLLHHHQNMWPGLKRLIEDHLANDTPLVLEGAALRPEYIAELKHPRLRMVCLHADPMFLRQRIRTNSNYNDRSPEIQACIDAFTERSLTENEALFKAAQEAGISCVAADAPDKA